MRKGLFQGILLFFVLFLPLTALSQVVEVRVGIDGMT